MIALVTDSSSQIPASLRDRFDVRVVPLTVVIDGEPFREGIDLTTDDFYARLGAGAVVSTAAPSPGEFLSVFEAAVEAGATEILAVHIGANTSATVNAASVAARTAAVPVEIVDTGTASFAVACCVWAAGEVLEVGGGVERAATAARAAAAQVDNVFVVGGLELARRGGRLDASVGDGSGVPVLALSAGSMHEVTRADTGADALDAMTAYVADSAASQSLRVGVGDAQVPELAREFAARLEALPAVRELVRYEIGPSVGAHTGPGTLGCCSFPG